MSLVWQSHFINVDIKGMKCHFMYNIEHIDSKCVVVLRYFMVSGNNMKFMPVLLFCNFICVHYRLSLQCFF